MGNINNVWYLKDSGGDWASTKCELDDCYSIPFDPAQDDSLYLQVNIPGGYIADEVWLCSLDGDRLQELLAITDYKKITGENNMLIFKMPQASMACKGLTENGCFVDLFNDGHIDPVVIQVVQDWHNGINNTQLQMLYLGVFYPLGTPGSNAALPPGFSWLNSHTIIVPCDVDFLTNGTFIYYTSDAFPAGGGFSFGHRIQHGLIPTNDKLNCWYLEIPLHLPEGGEVATLRSEPFHCPNCRPTLKISSDYCLSTTDIFGTFVFNTFAIEGTKTGDLGWAKNDFRIQAVLKQMPSSVTASRNLRCNNFKSKLQQRYKLQGAMPTDFPDYMVNIIESIFSGKKIYIEGEEYMPDGEAIFKERNVAGRSMKRLDVELVKCERGQVFGCNCELDCDEGAPGTSIFIYQAAPDMNTPTDDSFGIDRSYIYAEMSVTGPHPPYFIHDWSTNGECVPASLPDHPFHPNREYNIFRRKIDDVHMIGFQDGCTCLGYVPYGECPCDPKGFISITFKVTDARGCVYGNGLSVEREDMRCVGHDGSFSAVSTGMGQITISGITPFPSLDYDILIDNATVASGLTSSTYTVTGLTSGQVHKVLLVLRCAGDKQGRIGPMYVSVL